MELPPLPATLLIGLKYTDVVVNSTIDLKNIPKIWLDSVDTHASIVIIYDVLSWVGNPG